MIIHKLVKPRVKRNANVQVCRGGRCWDSGDQMVFPPVGVLHELGQLGPVIYLLPRERCGEPGTAGTAIPSGLARTGRGYGDGWWLILLMTPVREGGSGACVSRTGEA